MFLTTFALCAALVSVAPAEPPPPGEAAILARIQAPGFPARDFPITEHGAKDGADCSDAIAKAIEACAKAGGGRVVVPKGTWITGPVRLRSGVDLKALPITAIIDRMRGEIESREDLPA